MLPVAAFAATIGGTEYATQYDYREFFNAADGKPFRVVLAGNPFPGMPLDERRAAAAGRRCRPTSRSPASPSPTTCRPSGRARTTAWSWSSMPANDLGADSRLRGRKPRFKAGTPGRV